MKRSLTFVCLLASGLGLTALAQTSRPPCFSRARSRAAPAGPTKIAVIAFQRRLAAPTKASAISRNSTTKFDPKQAQLKAQSDEIESLKKPSSRRATS